MGSEDSCSSNGSARQHCCFGLFLVQSTFVSFVVLDLLMLSHSLIFTITNMAGGADRYAEGNRVFAEAVPYPMFLPLLAIQVIWLVTCLLAVVSLKTVLPYLQLPYLLCSGLVLASVVWLIVRVTGMLMDAELVTWPMLLMISTANVIFLEQVYFLYVKLVCFKMLIRKRKLVSTVERSLGKFTLGGLPPNNDQFDTYSTKSTVIVTDDYLNRVP